MKALHKEIERQTAPEIYGDFWFNSEPLGIRALQGQVIALFFWNYTSPSSVALLPTLQQWQQRYAEMGVVFIGVHTPEFHFAKNPQQVQDAIRNFGITYPVVTDNDRLIAEAYCISKIPSLCLVDAKGYLYDAIDTFNHAVRDGVQRHSFTRVERSLQYLLRQSGFHGALPFFTLPEYERGTPSAKKNFQTADMYTGYIHGSLGNVEGYSPELPAEYNDPQLYVEGKFYAHGNWIAKRNSFQYNGEKNDGCIIFRYAGNDVLILAGSTNVQGSVRVLLHGAPIAPELRGEDIHVDENGETYITIGEPSVAIVIRSQEFGEHVLTLFPDKKEISLYVFSFTEHKSYTTYSTHTSTSLVE